MCFQCEVGWTRWLICLDGRSSAEYLGEVVSAWFQSLLNKFKIHNWKTPWEWFISKTDKVRKQEAAAIGMPTVMELGPRNPMHTKAEPEFKVASTQLPRCPTASQYHCRARPAAYCMS